jgi:hypothetical protein
MNREPHAAAMTMFRIMGGFGYLRRVEGGIVPHFCPWDAACKSEVPCDLFESGRPFADEIGALLAIRDAESHRWSLDLPRPAASKRHAEPRRGEAA